MGTKAEASFESIQVLYPEAEVNLLGWHIHWEIAQTVTFGDGFHAVTGTPRIA